MTRKKVYGIALNLELTRHHPGYDYKKGAKWNFARGVSYAKKHHLPMLDVARQLQQLSNINKKRNKKAFDVYRIAAMYAYRANRSEKK